MAGGAGVDWIAAGSGKSLQAQDIRLPVERGRNEDFDDERDAEDL